MSSTNANLRERRQYRFGSFTLDLDIGFLRCDNEEVTLRPKSFEVLAYLVERHGRLVSRKELTCAVWPELAVTDEAVTKCIGDIRRAIHDDTQKLIRTVARRGYMFTAPVTNPAAEIARQIGSEVENVPLSVSSVGDISEPAREQVTKHAPLTWAQAAILTALLIAAGVAVVAFRAVRSGGGNRPAATQYLQLTNFTDSAFAPALSPDGRMLAFIRGENATTLLSKGEIYVKLLPDGEPVQLTHDGQNKMSPVFTSGGDRIAYGVPGLMTDPTSWSTWTISVFGGEPKLLLSNASGLTWIPGTSPPRILFSQVDRGAHMSIVTAVENRTEARTVYSPLDGMAHRSFLSPDRKQMLVVEMQSGWQPCRLVPFEAGEKASSSSRAGKLVGPSPGQCSSAAWSPDGKWMYFSVNTGNGYHIWRQRFPKGTPERVTFGPTEEQGIAFAPDGQSFLTSVGIRQSMLWLHDGRGERQITSEGYASLPRFSPDGRKLYFLLRSRTNRLYLSGELWVADLESGQRQRLLPDFLLADYSISLDGNSVVFVAVPDNGKTGAWLGRLDGRTAPRPLCNVQAYRAFFGTKGEVFVWGTQDGDKKFLYRIREDGTGLQKTIPSPIRYVYDVSPDGKAVAAWPESTVRVFPTDGNPPIDVSRVCGAAGGEDRGTTPPCVSWSPNGRFVYLNDRSAGQIYAVPIPRGRKFPVLPAGGIASEKDVASLPGARVIHEPYAFVGADPSVYAFFRIRTQRNIYRIRVP